MMGFSLPLEWPEDAGARAEMERHVLRMVSMLAEMPPEVAREVARGRAHELFVRSVAEHWPAGGERPAAVAELLRRYGAHPHDGGHVGDGH